MLVDYPNLKKSKTGFYSYRRAIPKKLRYLFENNRELKISFKTKDTEKAIQLWRKENREFDRKVTMYKTILKELGTSENKPPAQLVRQAELIAKQWSLHPSQQPSLKAGAGPQQRKEFNELDEAWLIKQEQASDLLTDKYDDGQGGYLPPDPRDPTYIAWKIAMGEIDVSPPPNWYDLMESYLAINIRNNVRNLKQEQKFKREASLAFAKVSAYLSNGMDTLLSDLDRQTLRQVVRDIWDKEATLKRNIAFLKSAFKTWNAEHGKDSIDDQVFDKLISEDRIRDQAIERRSFMPQELNLFIKAVEENEPEEICIFVQLMLQTGARNNEASGLHVNDLKLDSDTPHVIYRNNSIRLLEKGGYDRAVPINFKLASRIMAFIEASKSKEMLLPNWGNPARYDALSRRAGKHILNLRSADERSLVVYSLRHTFTDKCRAARVPDDIASYLQGHVGKASSKIHNQYGTRTPPAVIVEEVEKAHSVKEWGYFE
jgi:integrase